MLIGAPIARLATVITIGRPRPGGVVERLGHVEQALAGGRRVGARAGGRGADAGRHRGELGLDHRGTRTGPSSPRPDQVGEAPRRCGSAARSGRRRSPRAGSSATASATAREPSICLSMRRLPELALARSSNAASAPRRRCPSPTAPGNRSRIAADDRRRARPAASAPRSRRAAPRWAAGGRGARARARSPARSAAARGGSARASSPSPSSSKLAAGVDQHVAVAAAGRRRRRPGAAASGPGRSARRARRSARATRIGRSSMRQNDDDRRAGALGAEARERLRVAALVEGGDRQQLGRGDDALAAAAMKPCCEHLRQTYALPAGGSIGSHPG